MFKLLRGEVLMRVFVKNLDIQYPGKQWRTTFAVIAHV